MNKRRECVFCHKNFSANTLRVHLRVHTGEKTVGDKKTSQIKKKGYHQNISIQELPNSQLKKNPTKSNDIFKDTMKRHKCTFCGKKFSEARALDVHLKKTHKGENLYKCDLCGKTFNHYISITVHRRIHAGEKPKSCNGKFAQPDNVIGQKQMSKTKKEVPNKNISGLELSSGNQIDKRPKNRAKVNRKKEQHKCSFCGAKFSRARELNVHLKIHAEEKPDSANGIFAQPANVIVDEKMSQTKKQVQNINISGLELSSNSQIDKGPKNRTKLNSKKKQHKCSFCAKMFSEPRARDVHLRVHTGEKPYSCSFCDKKFAQLTNVIVHERTHTKEKPYSCTFCEKKFAQLSNVISHEKTHTKKELHSCNMKSAQPANTMGHKKMTQTKKKNNISNVELSSNNKLNEQAKNPTISNETAQDMMKRLECIFCGKKFGIASKLKVHLRIHTGEKPYSCSFCGKNFARASDMVVHERIHTKEKPYSCSFCEKKFTQSSTMICHEKTHSR